MNVYKVDTIQSLIAGNSYVGRGIVIGKSENSRYACVAYFIMGRSENSRNRVFVEKDGEVTIYPFDESKVKDPSLIIYSPIRQIGNKLIVTNGNQTDTIYDAVKCGKSFADALSARCFEPDAPNFTPRISGMLTFENNDFSYEMSILKSIDEEGSGCARFCFDYPSKAGLGHFIHTYVCDGNPIPTFVGEPERLKIGNDIDEFTGEIWNSLDPSNKISLYTVFVNLETGAKESRLINKNTK